MNGFEFYAVVLLGLIAIFIIAYLMYNENCILKNDNSENEVLFCQLQETVSFLDKNFSERYKRVEETNRWLLNTLLTELSINEELRKSISLANLHTGREREKKVNARKLRDQLIEEKVYLSSKLKETENKLRQVSGDYQKALLELQEADNEMTDITMEDI